MMDASLAQQFRQKVVDPRWSLPRFGYVLDQKSGEAKRYDPYAITRDTQATILSYYGDTPRLANGQTRWLVELGSRQIGKSLTPELAVLPICAFTPGFDHVVIADTRDRAQYLHDRVHFAYDRWPEEFMPRQTVSTKKRGLKFDSRIGGQMRVLSAEQQKGNVGIGQSPDSFHGSEIPFWDDPGSRFNLILPSMVNRDNALVCLESTPAPGDTIGVGWWKDLCSEAKQGVGRWIYKFSPFWDGLLNQREWKYGALDNEELRMLERFAPLGLTKRNLAFRRFMMEMDPEIRRNPDLFDVFYPSDDVSCWTKAASGVIPPWVWKQVIDRAEIVQWEGNLYQEFEPPKPGSQYVIGVDPAGYGARDHASFQVLEVWADEFRQVATFAGVTDPNTFGLTLSRIGLRYNTALIGCESNGVGAATLALLRHLGYPRIFHAAPGKPGVHVSANNQDALLNNLIEALIDTLVLRDGETLTQGMSYRNDKRTERAPSTELLTGTIGANRRERHHWDRVSALIMAVLMARKSPARVKPTPVDDTKVVPFSQMGYDAQREYIASSRKQPKSDSRAKYRSVRKRR